MVSSGMVSCGAMYMHVMYLMHGVVQVEGETYEVRDLFENGKGVFTSERVWDNVSPSVIDALLARFSEVGYDVYGTLNIDGRNTRVLERHGYAAATAPAHIVLGENQVYYESNTVIFS